MPWPLSQDYNEAIQNPASSFADPELRGGEAAVNALGMPPRRSGNFAAVADPLRIGRRARRRRASRAALIGVAAAVLCCLGLGNLGFMVFGNKPATSGPVAQGKTQRETVGPITNRGSDTRPSFTGSDDGPGTSSPQPDPKPAVDSTKDITNSIGMKLVLVPAGKFLMGSPPTEKVRSNDEHQHEVAITEAFYLGQYLVTKGDFAAFVKATGHPNPGKGQTDQHPVVVVDWKDAKAFCAWLSKKEGKAYRLPTEAEWEYSCRAGTTTAYSFGDDPSQLTAYGWYKDNAGGAAHQVGDKKPNAWGLYDMHGNVGEWCQDWYDVGYYKNSPRQDPQGPSAGAYRVNRGGSFDSAPRFCRAASRNFNAPAIRIFHIGFRVVRAR